MSRYVLLADIVDSRKIVDRDGFRTELSDACELLTDNWASNFDAEVKPIKGVDEIAGVLCDPAPIYEILDFLRKRLHPQTFRVAVAVGEIDVGLDSEDVSQMDGSAFHRADELLSGLQGPPLCVAFDFQDAPIDGALADEVNLLFLLKSRWTDHQRRVVDAYRETGSQSEAAETLGISQAAVSQALSRASYSAVREVEDNVKRRFSTL